MLADLWVGRSLHSLPKCTPLVGCSITHRRAHACGICCACMRLWIRPAVDLDPSPAAAIEVDMQRPVAASVALERPVERSVAASAALEQQPVDATAALEQPALASSHSVTTDRRRGQ